jgi:diphthamide biosynthesis methyltransferase
LHTLVVPSRLHFMEAMALVRFAGAPPEIAKED